ncbi:MarC family protein [Palleronia sp. LCG004]|uniref:MarC family protein n=1 Tax=Palleronia sp. LCG004 TaxID=3079304 RepID=UPI002941BDA2|nr:MarC family protein [Palleronia sp. LCG004]WOI55199.1 MarC family protein [Palleronia sp. LCG004]
MTPDFYVTAFVTLFVIIDPIGTTPIYMALTQGMARRRRRAIAMRACILGMAILLLFGLLGEQLLGFVGISMPAFRIAGGILLFLTALEMLFGRRTQRRHDQADLDDTSPEDDPSVFPLAIPLLAGPGGIASIILLTDQTGGDIWAQVGIFGVMIVIFAIVFALFLAAGLIEKALGDTGILVVTRLLGMLLAALSVQFVLEGLANFGLG